MSGPDDDSEKSHAPSQRRLDEARKRGEVPVSTDLLSAAALAGVMVAGLIFGVDAVNRAGLAGQSLIEGADRLANHVLTAPDAPMAGIGLSLIGPAAPFFALPVLFVLVSGILQRAFVLAPERIRPRLSRISPLAGARQRFGPDGWFNFAKSALKLSAVGAILVTYALSQGESILGSLRLSPGQSSVLMLRLMAGFLAIALLFTVVVGGVDYGWQLFRHLTRNRMSRQEVMDEMKDSEGDPHVKGRRRQRGQEIAMNRMLADVARADVVIVNPSHYAVALKWKRGDRSAPVCLAKGVDEVAARIRERAAAYGVPLHRDPPTARALHATVEVGQPIRPEHYRAVAAAIRFAETMRRRAKGWRR
jgi:flagellar biosynthetic protein FlhB